MSNKDILKKAIDKAIKNGYWHGYYTQHNFAELYENEWFWYNVIFSHYFAKAFWGKNKVCYLCGHTEKECRIEQTTNCGAEGFGGFTISWKYHLQQMVLEEEPLEYIRRFLK